MASCADGTEAVKAIRDLAPDLVFLDVRMPGKSGFEVIEEIGVERMPAVIFLTAYEQHALDAFRVNAVDYLLKPLEQAKLTAALARARRDLTEQNLVRRANELVVPDRPVRRKRRGAEAAARDASSCAPAPTFTS